MSKTITCKERILTPAVKPMKSCKTRVPTPKFEPFNLSETLDELGEIIISNLSGTINDKVLYLSNFKIPESTDITSTVFYILRMNNTNKP